MSLKKRKLGLYTESTDEIEDIIKRSIGPVIDGFKMLNANQQQFQSHQQQFQLQLQHQLQLQIQLQQQTIEPLQTRIQRLEAAIERLTKEIADLQIHALNGAFGGSAFGFTGEPPYVHY
jgi:hypothetical protein